MNILILISKRHDDILRISKTLKNMGHNISSIYVDDYQSCHGYLAKKCDELHIGNGREKDNCQRAKENPRIQYGENAAKDAGT